MYPANFGHLFIAPIRIRISGVKLGWVDQVTIDRGGHTHFFRSFALIARNQIKALKWEGDAGKINNTVASKGSDNSAIERWDFF